MEDSARDRICLAISIPHSHIVSAHEAHHQDPFTVLQAVKADVASHVRLDLDSPWIQSLTLSFSPTEAPQALLVIPAETIDSMALTDIKLAAMRPVVPTHTKAAVANILARHPLNRVALDRGVGAGLHSRYVQPVESNSRIRSRTASSGVAHGYGPSSASAPTAVPPPRLQCNTIKLRTLSSGSHVRTKSPRLETHTTRKVNLPSRDRSVVVSSTASVHSHTGILPAMYKRAFSSDHSLPVLPVSGRNLIQPSYQPVSAEKRGTSGSARSVGSSTDTAHAGKQNHPRDRTVCDLPSTLSFLKQTNVFDLTVAEEHMKQFGGTESGEKKVLLCLERQHATTETHTEDDRTGQYAKKLAVLVGGSLDPLRFAVIRNMSSSRQRLVGEHLRNDIIEHFRNHMALWPQDVTLEIDSTGTFLSLFLLKPSTIQHKVLLQNIEQCAAMPMELMHMSAVMERYNGSHLSSAGSQESERISSKERDGQNAPSGCVMEHPNVHRKWSESATASEKGLLIPLTIQLPEKYHHALDRLNHVQLEMICQTVQTDILQHLQYKQLHRWIADDGIRVDPSSNLSALDADIRIAPNATREQYYAVRSRLSENIPITRTDSLLERMLASGCDTKASEAVIALTMRIPDVHAARAKSLSLTNLTMLREEARHDIHDCLTRAGLGECVPLHMIQINPSLENGAFDVDVHIPKSLRQGRFEQIQSVLSSEVIIPRTGVLLDQLFNQQGRNTPLRSGSRSKSIPRTRTTMIIPVTMRLSSIHARALRSISIAQLAELQDLTRQDVHAHVSQYGLSAVIKPEHITVNPAPHLNALNVDVKLLAGSAESIHRRLRDALSETISIPRAGEHLGILLRERRQEHMMDSSSSSVRTHRITTSTARTQSNHVASPSSGSLTDRRSPSHTKHSSRTASKTTTQTRTPRGENLDIAAQVTSSTKRVGRSTTTDRMSRTQPVNTGSIEEGSKSRIITSQQDSTATSGTQQSVMIKSVSLDRAEAVGSGAISSSNDYARYATIPSSRLESSSPSCVPVDVTSSYHNTTYVTGMSYGTSQGYTENPSSTFVSSQWNTNISPRSSATYVDPTVMSTEYQRGDPLLSRDSGYFNNTSSSNLLASGSLTASSSFSTNELLSGTVVFDTKQQADTFAQIPYHRRSELIEAIQCDVLVHLRGLPINLQASDVRVTEMSGNNIRVEVPLKAAITRGSKDQLRAKMGEPIKVNELRACLEKFSF